MIRAGTTRLRRLTHWRRFSRFEIGAVLFVMFLASACTQKKLPPAARDTLTVSLLPQQVALLRAPLMNAFSAAVRGGAETMYPEDVVNIASAPEAHHSAALEPAKTGPSGEPAIHVQRVRGNVYMLTGAGGNIALQAGDEGVLLVATGLSRMTGEVLAAIKQLSNRPIRYIIDTHVHPDHIGGNEAIAKQGETLAGGDVTNLTSGAREGARVVAHENVVARLTAPGPGRPATPFGTLPNDSYYGSHKDLFFNDEGVRIVHPPAAHTDGDSMVFFRRSDGIGTGDVFVTGYPFIDLARGGSIQGEIAALNGGTYIVPGHGRLCDAADVAYYRNMVTVIRGRILDMKKRGLTVEQVKAAKPTQDYDPHWGATSGFWTTDLFVEAVYKSVEGELKQ